MDYLDLLSTMAEVSVGLAGFAGIIVAIRNPTEIGRVEATGLTLIVWHSLTTLFVSLGLIWGLSSGIPEANVWRSASVLVVLAGSLFIGYSLFALRGKLLRSFSDIPNLFLGWIFPLLIIFLNAMNVIGLVIENESTPVFAAGILSMLITAFFFARLLLGPVTAAARRNKKEKEARVV
jgi:hypothetical protein